MPALLVSAYYDKRYLIAAPAPFEATRYRMERQDLRKSYLVPIPGFKSKVADLLNAHRKHNIGMIHKLHSQLNIPLGTLIKEY